MRSDQIPHADDEQLRQLVDGASPEQTATGVDTFGLNIRAQAMTLAIEAYGAIKEPADLVSAATTIAAYLRGESPAEKASEPAPKPSAARAFVETENGGYREVE